MVLHCSSDVQMEACCLFLLDAGLVCMWELGRSVCLWIHQCVNGSISSPFVTGAIPAVVSLTYSWALLAAIVKVHTSFQDGTPKIVLPLLMGSVIASSSGISLAGTVSVLNQYTGVVAVLRGGFVSIAGKCGVLIGRTMLMEKIYFWKVEPMVFKRTLAANMPEHA